MKGRTRQSATTILFSSVRRCRKSATVVVFRRPTPLRFAAPATFKLDDSLVIPSSIVTHPNFRLPRFLKGRLAVIGWSRRHFVTGNRSSTAQSLRNSNHKHIRLRLLDRYRGSVKGFCDGFAGNLRRDYGESTENLREIRDL